MPVLIFCTAPDGAVARKIASVLVGKKLAACVSLIHGVRSVYRWKGKIEKAREVLLMIKAPAKGYGAIQRQIKRHHPYEVPEIVAAPIKQGSKEYLRWIEQSCV